MDVLQGCWATTVVGSLQWAPALGDKLPIC